MQAPSIPLDEKERLNTLLGLNILNTPAEERFDRYARIAASMFDMPVALVSLIDRNRQWFKAFKGMDIRQTTRNVSVCGHAILQNDVFVVEDLAADDRFVDNFKRPCDYGLR